MSGNLDEITPVLLTFNEEANIGRTAARLGWASDIVVVDSGSTDATLEILARLPRVRVMRRPFDSHAAQWNFAVSETGVRTKWILALDADYVLTDEFMAGLSARELDRDFDAYRASFLCCVAGRPLRGSLYPPVTVLFQTGRAYYVQDGHTQRLSVEGRIGDLAGKILHDDRKSLARWFGAQQRYAALEADHLLALDRAALSIPDRVRRTAWAGPIAVFGYTLIVKGCILDGWRGWFYVLQRTLVETMLALEVLDRRLSKAD